VRDEGCLVYAAGCSTVELEARRQRTLVVSVDAVAGAACADRERCDDGLCEAGEADADVDADADADAERDRDADVEADVAVDADPDGPEPCVVSDRESLQRELYSGACPVITLRDGAYVGQIFILRSVTLEGTSVAGTILSGDAADPSTVVSVFEDDAAVVLRRLTITGGLASGQGGGVSSIGALTLDGVVVTGNSVSGATADGGGVYSAGPSLTLLGGTQVTGNSVGCPADAACCGGVVLRGGGISARGGDVAIDEGSVVGDNGIACDCAAACASLGSVTAYGGGVAVEEGTLRLAGGSSVAGNRITIARDARITVQGGGICLRGDSTAELAASSISSNVITVESMATGDAAVQALGGGISALCPWVVAEGMVVARNEITASSPQQNVTVQGAGMRLSSQVELYPATVRIAETTVDANVARIVCPGGACTGTQAAQGGGVYLYFNNTAAELANELVVERTTVSDDRIETTGTGVGSGVFVRVGETDELHVVNTTISGNAGVGAVTGIGLAAQGPGALDVRSVTIHANGSESSGSVGGGLNAGAGLSLAMDHAIVAGNAAATCDEVHVSSPSLLTGASNLLGAVDAACPLSAALGYTEGDPLLEALAANGGPTLTHAIGPGSPAVDGGAETCTDGAGVALATDQRGPGYDRVVNGRCDIGAYELQP
jgi:hypothetical protein